MITWPPIDDEIRSAVLEQMDASVSIYDRSGIIERFEDAFAARHNARHALLTSSGTGALHSAYYALMLGRGDEVLVQDYTFFATAMPLFQLGVTPVLVDVRADGEVDLEHAESLLTPATKALVVTHMWGNPHDTARLRAWCDSHGLFLIEDCSHAHGASRNGVSVGELADAACWSLQGRKTITAGEGGILTTPHRSVYDRATLLGHFNKRALQTVDPHSALYEYAETGLGLKYRINPLGLAMAEVHLGRLDDWLSTRRRHAVRLESLLADRPGIKILTPTGSDRVSTLYAFVFTIDPGKAGFSREDLLRELRARGCDEITTCDAMMPLHTYPAFHEPRSPVASYKTPLARGPLPVSERLAATALRVAVPSVDDEEGRAHADAVTRALNAALSTLDAATLRS